MVSKYGTGQDPYSYPNTQILQNKLGIRDDVELELAERKLTELAITNIRFHPPPYDLVYWCDLHRQLFGEIYDWSGQIRTVDISKGGNRFCGMQFIENEARKIFNALKQDHYLVNLTRPMLIKKVAEYYSELNVLHPFREGNGRTQRLLFEHLIINCGYRISFLPINQTQWIAANIAGFNCDYDPLTTIFDLCIE